MMYTPTRICCPDCKTDKPLSELSCTCPQCENDFNPFQTFGGCVNCPWTAGGLKCRACGKRHDISDWLAVQPGEQRMFQFFRSVLALRESIFDRQAEGTETRKSENKKSGFASVITLSATVHIRGRRVEKKVVVEDSGYIIGRQFLPELKADDFFKMDTREWYLERTVFERALKQMTRDLRQAVKLKAMLKDSTIRIVPFSVARLPHQVKTLRKFFDLLKGKSADIFFTIENGRSLKDEGEPQTPATETPSGGGQTDREPVAVEVSELHSWQDLLVNGGAKMVELFEQLIREGRSNGVLCAHTIQPSLLKNNSVEFAAEHFQDCAPYLLYIFEEMEMYETCARIMVIKGAVRNMPQPAAF